MKKKFCIAIVAIACALFTWSCKKDKDAIPPIPHNENTSTGTGTPVGIAITKTIDAAGGEIASADGTIKIIIPAGALNAAREISIQPITNKLPAGIGNAFRLTPHGEQFAKPVTVAFTYKQEDLDATAPEFLDIAYQDAQGDWQAITNRSLDKISHEIKVTTTHFSDWTYFKSLKLEPAAATVETGAVLELKLTTTFPYLDPDDAPAGSNTVPVYTSPRELRSDEIKGWTYSGEGSLDPDASKAIYAAPDHVPSTNPEAIAVNINLHRKGQFMLVSNITVLGDQAVKYLRVDEDYLSPINKGKCGLYLYGSFGNDPGASKRSVTIDGTAVDVDLWSPGILRCFIDREISGAIAISSNNKVIARSVLRKFKGSFLYTRYHGGVSNAGSPSALKETTKFDLVFRGFGTPCPADLDPLFTFDQGLAEGSEAHFTLSGSASVTAPAGPDHCASTTSVSLPASSGLQPVNPFSVSSFSRFKGYITETQDGLEIKIDFNINNVIDGVKVQRTDCTGTSYDPPRSLGVYLEGFNMKPIDLRFWGTDELSLKGDKLKSGRLSSGILIEAWDNTVGNPTHYETDGLIEATFENAY